MKKMFRTHFEWSSRHSNTWLRLTEWIRYDAIVTLWNIITSGWLKKKIKIYLNYLQKEMFSNLKID